MAKMMTTSQKKNKTIPGMAYPATSLDLATASGYPALRDLFRKKGTQAVMIPERRGEGEVCRVCRR